MGVWLHNGSIRRRVEGARRVGLAAMIALGESAQSCSVKLLTGGHMTRTNLPPGINQPSDPDTRVGLLGPPEGPLRQLLRHRAPSIAIHAAQLLHQPAGGPVV